MKKHLLWMAALAATLGAGLASAQNYGNNPGYGNGYSQARNVRCESRQGDRNFCRTPIRGPVRLIRQLSRTACIRGRSWYPTSTGIWVSNGCRAVFAVGRSRSYGNPNPVVRDEHYTDRNGRTVHCESTANGRTYCGNAHSRYSMSGNRDPDCIEGRTWGSDGRGVWVSGDCDADFNGSPYDWSNGGRDRYNQDDEEVAHEHIVDPSGRMIHCQSTADGRNYCGERDSRYVMSSRDPDCIEGVTYGRDARGTWVTGECDAQFMRDENDDDDQDDDDHDLYDHQH